MKRRTEIGMAVLIIGVVAPVVLTPLEALITQPCVEPPPGIVSWWPLDGSTRDIVDENDGLLSGDAAYTTGKVWQALNLDSVDDGMVVLNTPNLSLQQLTIEAWILAFEKSEIPHQTIIEKSAQAGYTPQYTTNYGFYILSDNDPYGRPAGVLQFQCSQGGTMQWRGLCGSIVVADTSWHHVAVTYNGLTARLFVDGDVDCFASPIANPPPFGILDENDAPLGIGYAGSEATRYFQGLIDEVAIYNRALTPTEIDSIFIADSAGKCKLACIQPPDSLVSWWRAEGDATDFQDGNDGTLVGGTSFASGRVGQAFSFDGSNDRVEVPHHSSLALLDFTVEAWFKVEAVSRAYPHLLIKGQATATNENRNYWIAIDRDAGNVLFAGSSFGGVPRCVGSGTDVADGTWHHVAYVVDDSSKEQKIYLDGALKDTGSFTGSADTQPYDLWIGKTTIGDAFDGQIDEVSIYNRALSAPEVLNLFDSYYAGKCTGMVDVEEFPRGPQAAEMQIYPNPSNTQITIDYFLPSEGRMCLTLYDVAGRRVATLVDQVQPAGRRSVIWDGRDEGGAKAASGVYFARLEFDRKIRTQKIVLL